MYPSGVSKLRVAVFIVIIIVIWRTAHYFSQLEENVIQNEKLAEFSVNSKQPVVVTIYYEALCSDSRNFILKQLVPTYEKLSDVIEIDLVPYGKATTMERDGTYVFECQHSYIECDANKIHACVLDQPFPKDIHLKYVACMIKDNMVPHEAGSKCADEVGVDYRPIRECANGLEGSELLKTYGVRTHAVSPKITFIPTIQLNYSSRVPLVNILKDLFKEVCNLFDENPPKQCL